MFGNHTVYKQHSLVTAFLVDNFNWRKYVDSCITGLNLWVDLLKFIHITTINNADDYKKQMDTFESNLNVFFNTEGKSFLTKGTVAGDDETFYMNVF